MPRRPRAPPGPPGASRTGSEGTAVLRSVLPGSRAHPPGREQPPPDKGAPFGGQAPSFALTSLLPLRFVPVGQLDQFLIRPRMVRDVRLQRPGASAASCAG